MTDSAPGGSAVARVTRGDRALAWWMRHCHPVEGDPATRARLRRCRSTTEALSIPAAISLARRVRTSPAGPTDDDWRLTAGLDLARVLAHITEHDGTHRPMQAVGWRSFPGDRRESDTGNDRPRLSEARFRRLLQTERGEEQVTAFVRLIALLGGAANVPTIAGDFLYWGDRTKRRWAFDYYAAGVAAPADSLTIAEDPDA